MTPIVIEKGVPIPHKQVAPRQEYPLMEMKAGDSFVITKGRLGHVYRLAKAYGVLITARSIDRDNTRVWKVN